MNDVTLGLRYLNCCKVTDFLNLQKALKYLSLVVLSSSESLKTHITSFITLCLHILSLFHRICSCLKYNFVLCTGWTIVCRAVKQNNQERNFINIKVYLIFQQMKRKSWKGFSAGVQEKWVQNYAIFKNTTKTQQTLAYTK